VTLQPQLAAVRQEQPEREDPVAIAVLLLQHIDVAQIGQPEASLRHGALAGAADAMRPGASRAVQLGAGCGVLADGPETTAQM
jgi:hypothetical protein